MSTGARGGGRGRGRGRGQGRGRGRGAKAAPASTEAFATTTVEDNSVSTPAAPQQQKKKKDVTMTEKNVNNKTEKKPNNKPAAAPAPAPAAPAAPAKTNNNNKNNKNRKRGRQEAENGDVPIVEANETASPNEDNDTPIEPPAKRQRTENGHNNFRKKRQQQKPRDENWEPGNAHLKGETTQMTILNTPVDGTVEEIEELVEKETGIRPTQVRVIPRTQRQRNPDSQPKPQPGKAHITFETPEQATTAVEKLRGLQYKGNEFKTQYSKEVKIFLNEEYSGISPVLKLYEAFGTTQEDIIDAINKYCTNVPDKIVVRRIYTKGYDYGVASINTGDVEVAKRMKKELEGKLIKDQTPLIGFWAQPWKLNQGQEQEEMQVDNE